MKRSISVILLLLLLTALLIVPAGAQARLTGEERHDGFRVYTGTYSDGGASVQADTGKVILVCIAGSFLIALIVVCVLRRGMKNVRRQPQAKSYLVGGLNLTDKRDQFTHKTESRRKIETNSGSSKARSGR